MQKSPHVVNFENSTSGHFLTVNGIPLQMYTTACSVLQSGLCRENCVKPGTRNGNFSGLTGFQHVNAAAGSRIFPAEFQVFVCVGGGGVAVHTRRPGGPPKPGVWATAGHGSVLGLLLSYLSLSVFFMLFPTFSLYCSPFICLFASLSLQISCWYHFPASSFYNISFTPSCSFPLLFFPYLVVTLSVHSFFFLSFFFPFVLIFLSYFVCSVSVVFYVRWSACSATPPVWQLNWILFSISCRRGGGSFQVLGITPVIPDPGSQCSFSPPVAVHVTSSVFLSLHHEAFHAYSHHDTYYTDSHHEIIVLYYETYKLSSLNLLYNVHTSYYKEAYYTYAQDAWDLHTCIIYIRTMMLIVCLLYST